MHKLLLPLILLLGLGLRIYNLSSFPPGLNWDEASLGYNAYSLALTGKDEWGVTHPTIFRAFGDYKLPVYVYVSVPSVLILGLNEFSIRLPSALAGVLTVAVSYVLAYRIFGRKSAVITALLVALEPWTLFLSRLALEANYSILILTLGMALLISRRFLLSLVFLSLSAWTYNSARVFVPLFIFGYSLIHRKQIISFLNLHKLRFITGLTILALFLGPMFIQLLSPGAQSRFRWLNIIDSGAIASIEQNRNQSTLSPQFRRLLFNRPTYFIHTFLTNYFRYLSPQFLFLSGGDHYQFSVQDHGLLYLYNLPLFYLAIWFILKSTNLSHKSLILLWLLLSPIPGSLVRDAPHTLRAITMLPLPMFFSAYALSKIAKKFPLVLPLFLVLISISFYLYANKALTSYSREYSAAFQFGHRQLVTYLKDHYDGYNEILITKKYGEPHEFILFYWPWNADFYRSDPNLIRYGRSDWFWVDSFAKFRFINDWEMLDTVSTLDPDKKYLIVASPDNSPPATDLRTINFLNGSPAFLIKEK